MRPWRSARRPPTPRPSYSLGCIRLVVDVDDGDSVPLEAWGWAVLAEGKPPADLRPALAWEAAAHLGQLPQVQGRPPRSSASQAQASPGAPACPKGLPEAGAEEG